QNEIAGRETGRRARFLRDGPGSEAEKKKARETQRALSRLAELLLDPIYRAKHDSVLLTLSRAEQAARRAIDHLTDQLQDAQAALGTLVDSAARLPDGTRVFRDAHGVVRRGDGRVVEDHLADTILWTGNEPSFEEMQAAKQRLDALQAQLDDVHGYQNDVLGPARDRITDPETPPSLDSLDDIEDGIRSKMPDAVRAQEPVATPEIAKGTDLSAMAVPDLGAGR
ncbi:MAG: hypothetical protein AAF674_22840, partial [Pseudomonadota bacterium]